MNFDKLSVRIAGILVGFFVVALTAISLTLFISWQLEGSAAAINDAGSQRMRTYRMAYLLSQQSVDSENVGLYRDIIDEVAVFDRVMAGLEHGDPARPLFLPKEAGIQQLVRDMRERWRVGMKPQIERLAAMHRGEERSKQLIVFRASVQDFVSLINRLVVEVENSSAHSTATLRLVQNGLILLALIGTLILISFFFAMVIRPVEEMRGGIRRMAEADFSVRLPILRSDEFGELSAGFNRMADRLEDLYGKLEQRVEEKTRDIAEKHRELTLLYEVAAFLNQPATIEAACLGVLDQVTALLDAQGGLVRLVDDTGKQMQLRIKVQRGLSEDFLRRESSLAVGECLCGTVAADGTALSKRLATWQGAPAKMNCRDVEGFAALAAIPIRSKNRILGIFNLFFSTPRTLKENEIRLLETVGQHLGVAIENQRLVTREKEMAVSEERNLLAQELHDSIAQSLSFLNIQAQMLQDSIKREDTAEASAELARIREGIQESYDDVRELLVHFRTRVDVDNNLDVAIASALEKFEGQTGIATSLAQHGTGCDIPPQNAIQILHIVQETLSNVRKHAGATQVDVAIECHDVCAIRVRDNGRGFDPAARESDTHVGLKIMRERAHRIGGRLDIQSQPGAGTTVALILSGETV